MGVAILQMFLFLRHDLFIAGQETKSMLNNSGPRYKRSKIERKMNTDVLFCVVLLFFMCLIGALGTVRGTSPSIIQTHTTRCGKHVTSTYKPRNDTLILNAEK